MTKKKKLSADEKLNERIDKLLVILNQPETACKFWWSDDPNAHIMGVRPIKRTSIEVINKDGFNPLDKKTDEKLFKFFLIYILNDKEDKIQTKEEIEKKKEIESNGTLYIKHHDLLVIYEFVRNNA